MSLRRLFRCAGTASSSAASPVVVSTFALAVSLMPAAHAALYSAAEAIRAANEWDAGTPTNTVSSSWANLPTAISGLTANTHNQINITDTGTTTTAITLPAKDMGTGSVTINGGGLQVDAQITVTPGARNIKWRNFDFLASGIAFGAQSVLPVGSSTPGTIMRWDSTIRFGRLLKAGKTEADWLEYTIPISCFHAEQLIFDGCQFYGVSFHGGVHAVDLLVVRGNDSRQFYQSAWTGSAEYYTARTKAPVIGSGKRYAFFYSNTFRAQWDRMSLWTAAAGAGGSSLDVPHVDAPFQATPPDTYPTTVGSAFSSGLYGVTSAGKVYKCTSSTANLTAEPTGTGTGISAGGATWDYVGVSNDPILEIYMIDNVAVERGVTVQAVSNKHTQIQFVRDSHRAGGHLAYDSSKLKFILAGNLSASSSGGYQITGATSVYASHNTYAGPVTPSSSTDQSNIVPANFDLSTRTTGVVDSVSEVIGTASATGLTLSGNAPCDARSGASVGQRPGDLFAGSFTTDGQGNWKVDDTNGAATALLSEATSRAAFLSLAQSVFARKPGVSAGAPY